MSGPFSALVGFATSMMLPGNMLSNDCVVSISPVRYRSQLSTKVPSRGFCASTIFFVFLLATAFLATGFLVVLFATLVLPPLRAACLVDGPFLCDACLADFFGALATLTAGAGRSGR